LHDPEPHLIPLVIQAALRLRSHITVNGTDYPTPDGTAVRDYIHVSDLAEAHVAALERLLFGGESVALNLGTGHGTSIREIIAAVTAAAGRAPTVREGQRRPGDPPILVADPARAKEVLGWTPTRSEIDTIAGDAVRWYRDILPALATVA
jgi:UDP-glucose 4-epimerase